MSNDFNEQHAIAKANIRQKNKPDSMLRSALNSLAVARRKQTKLKAILTKEQADVRFDSLNLLCISLLDTIDAKVITDFNGWPEADLGLQR